MSNKWSTIVQGVNTLNLNRELRFSGDNFNQIINILGIKEGMNILDTGCGPGTFTRKLSDLIKHLHITGIDNDNNFIEYCRKIDLDNNIKNVIYDTGDALSLPYKDNQFDICTSHTVIEHLPNKEFLQEQYRVCKDKGKVSIMNVRAELSLKSDTNSIASDREEELLSKIGDHLEVKGKDLKVGKYSSNPQQILKVFEELGLVDIQLNVVPYIICIDDARNSIQHKKQIVESERKSILEFVTMALSDDPSLLTNMEKNELTELINLRFDNRINAIESDNKLWDFSISPMIIISGTKRAYFS